MGLSNRGQFIRPTTTPMTGSIPPSQLWGVASGTAALPQASVPVNPALLSAQARGLG